MLRTSQEYGPKRQDIPLETHAETIGVQRFARVHGRHKKQSPGELIAVDSTRDPMAPVNRVPSTNKRSIIAEDDHSSGSSSVNLFASESPNIMALDFSILNSPGPSGSEQEQFRIMQWMDDLPDQTTTALKYLPAWLATQFSGLSDPCPISLTQPFH
jgi:hypothetical protein